MLLKVSKGDYWNSNCQLTIGTLPVSSKRLCSFLEPTQPGLWQLACFETHVLTGKMSLSASMLLEMVSEEVDCS